ncbi:GNAT family N-acetyltransferase [Streptomyces sp. 549]|uniref:GNAT family N-acetyltransferase n=1 Tax=Streptomyces sp. 549 TaxID=3049076 RepID=UPI0024C293F3|nr:GNAT family N-acetyltransferase [Streptomyces sp. 549]MDK1476190.1 GNAT family N-acetyltransferase [Streptomyces sp. 549]
MSLPLRTLRDPSDLPGWLGALAVGFLRAPEVTDEEVAFRAGAWDIARAWGVYDGVRCVATYRTFAQQLTLPGGRAVPASAVTNVTVSATHRRRGLLTRMMGAGLADARERSDVCATLIAAEYPIYGRYGFGPAAWTTDVAVDVLRTGLDPRRPADTGEGTVELVSAEELGKLAPGVHERFRALPDSAGAVDRSERWWRLHTGALHDPVDPLPVYFRAVYRDAAGEPQGFVSYAVDDRWEAKLPHVTATVRDLIATTPAAERALWRYLMAIDWVTTLKASNCPPDDVLPLLLPDPRAARLTTHADFLWVRPLDVPALLESRSYRVPGGLVLEVHDPDGPAAGRYALDAAPEGARCTRTTRSADLTLDAAALGTLSLGDESAVRLAVLGRIHEEHPGAAAQADALLRAPRRAWCPDVF